MMSNNYCVYSHLTPSGKQYIGITKQNPQKRWKNGKGYEACTAFNRAIVKYGWENIKHTIIVSGITKEEACFYEQYYISLFDTANPLHGYNLTLGGENYEPNEEWRRRASEAHKEFFKNNPEAKNKISKFQTGRKLSPATRLKMSNSRKKYIADHPEEKEKCRNTFKGIKRSKENCEKLRLANQQKVRCIETGVVFESVNEAALFANVCRSAVSNYLTGRSKNCGGYHFEYYKEGENAE